MNTIIIIETAEQLDAVLDHAETLVELS